MKYTFSNKQVVLNVINCDSAIVLNIKYNSKVLCTCPLLIQAC